MFAVLPLIEWKPLQLCRAKALHYRGVIGQWQDVGRSRFDVVRHGGRCDPAGSAALFFALPWLTHPSSHSPKANARLWGFWLTFGLQVGEGRTRWGNTPQTRRIAALTQFHEQSSWNRVGNGWTETNAVQVRVDVAVLPDLTHFTELAPLPDGKLLVMLHKCSFPCHDPGLS